MVARRQDPASDFIVAGVDLREVGGCTCLRLRKATRRVTQIYEACLEPAALTIGQFGILAVLQGLRAKGTRGLSMGQLADHLGVDPTTLKRTLGPLVDQHLVAVRPDAQDRRLRHVGLTEGGSARLAEALPLWRLAQNRLGALLEAGTLGALDRALEDAYAKLRDAPVP